MNDIEYLFVHTIADLRSRMVSEEPYVILGAAALLRKLFLDGSSLFDRANSAHRLKLSFFVNNVDTPYHRLIMEDKPSFWSLQDGIDPEVTGGSDTIDMKRDSFFSTIILIVGGHNYSIRNVILYEANLMGAVHAGTPKNEKEQVLSAINQLYIGDTRATLRQLKSICSIAAKACDPLLQLVKQNVSLV